MFTHPTGKKPKKVVLVGCGPTMQDYVNLAAASDTPALDVDEVWGINMASNAIRTDLTFQMDDYALFANSGKSDSLAEFIRTADHPIITSVPREACPTAVAFPLGDVLMLPGAKEYLNHTAAYAIAYALMIGVEELIIFGCDYIAHDKPYTHTTRLADKPARYMACSAYWCGLAEAQGMSVMVSPNSALLDSDTQSKFYGYLIQPVIRREEEPAKPTLVDNEEKEEANG